MGCSTCSSHKEPMPKLWHNPKVITATIAGLLLTIGFVGSYLTLPKIIANGFYVGAVLIGGYYFAREAIDEFIKEYEIGIEFLMSLAAIVAGIMGQWAEAATLVFLYSISEAAEGYSGERARHAIRALMDLAPKTALIRRNNTEFRIPIEEIHIGDEFIVLPGESLATDGEVISGHSSVNQAPITGESIPVEKTIGSKVFSATINGEGTLTVRATKKFADNTLSRIIFLVEKAQDKKGRSQRFIERFGNLYSPFVLLVGILIATLPPLFGQPWQEWVIRATVFIVAAAPCALVISIPITLVAALGTASRNGILLKGGLYLEQLVKIKVIALDKTGTLTQGKPKVTDIIPLNNHTRNQILNAAATLESRSQHPMAQAILQQANEENIQYNPVEQFKSLTGSGVLGFINGEKFYIGNPKLFIDMGLLIETLTQEINKLQAAGKTVVLLGTDKEILGLIAIADPLRPTARQMVSNLKSMGIERVVMLTGDNLITASSIGEQAGVDEVFSDLSPEDKTRKIEELERRYGKVMMVGDGVNDAPALAAAHVGVAMGAVGTDVALETADVALMGDNLLKLPYLIAFSRRTWNIILQNLGLSIIVISSLVVGAITGYFTLPIAVLAHEISELIVIASGLRMLKS
ncbi:TPA: heavy metal translocating P-type ATPase [Legionella pneumophila]|uniref:P-type Zn(2+) transporter n=3 Tax=Legionella pneumophila TaxID=446 RepID=Q5ZWS5_LEGPH|nr:cation-translocating P-type ATPase [Legionella pneumophila]PNL78624.1 cation-transporting P-type ATPase [Legionella pneumophila subsp. pneumophila]AAM00635.1 putative cadmium efflux ATPase [Legionella pneumophila]AAU27096.1 cadmium efflux ATPase [Legionella pneumophila subsp. pneumophila str. Philadelphia 1]AGH54270.1 Lead, cadmium, zinc and mercury transporting ATPase [Legionella pneumophila subsp. pneumophila LPE509]AOU04083.1 ATPase [Legionella pneumophila]